MIENSFLAEFNTKHELSRMIQLVLGCAINCEDKERRCCFYHQNSLNCLVLTQLFLV